MLKHFLYLNEIPKALINDDWSKTAREYHLCGGRLSGKTRSVIEMVSNVMIVAIKENINVSIYAFRQQAGDVKEFDSTFKKRFIDSNVMQYLNYSFGTFRPLYKPIKSLGNQSIVKIIPVQSSRADKTPLKGLDTAEGSKLILIILEEADEFTADEKSAIKSAIRGDKDTKTITIMMCNPDRGADNYYIKYLNTCQPFDLKKMSTEHHQFSVKNLFDIKSVFQYTNFLLNPYLPIDSIREMEKMRSLDEWRARSWYYGVLTANRDGVFTDIEFQKSHVNSIPFFINRYVAGLDLGFANNPTGHPTAGGLWGIDNGTTSAVKLAEYYFDKEHMVNLSILAQANDIIVWCRDLFRKFPRMHQVGLTVRVDYGSGGLAFIDVLRGVLANYIENNPLSAFLNHKLHFKPVDKKIWFIKDRVEAFTSMMDAGKMKFMWKQLPRTREQYGKMTFMAISERAKNQQPTITDKYDDFFDSDYYALSEERSDIIKSIKDGALLFPKSVMKGIK